MKPTTPDSKPDSKSPFLTPDQLAERWRVSHDSVHKVRLSGTGPPFLQVVPRRYVYPLDALEKWEAENLTTVFHPKPKRRRRKKDDPKKNGS